MSLRTLLVPMVGDAADRRALDLAGRIALRHQSRVTALFAEPDDREIPMAMVGDATGGYLSRDLVKTLQDRIESRRTTALATFEQWRDQYAIAEAAAGSASAEFVREVGADGALIRTYGLVADLIITVRPDPTEAERSAFFEGALFEAGKPALMVPKGELALPPEDAPIQIVWRQTLVSARALSASLPFLGQAREIIVSQAVNAGEAPAVDGVVRYLAWHGITARAVIHPGPRDPVRLLNEVTKNGVGMLVFGAYAHSRAHALVFGGITRHVVENAQIPVLFAH
jgi:nucleotide-binding universal stress UspA family protein